MTSGAGRGLPNGEPATRRWVLRAFREAALVMYGEAGLQDIASRMPEDVRKETVETVLLPEWLPERYVIAWSFAVWEGPAGRDKPKMMEFLDRQTDLGFGRLRRTLIGFASPRTIIEKAPALWKEDHTAGELSYELDGERVALLRLRDHPFTEIPQARASIAEVFRYSVSLTRGQKGATVTETHRLESPGVCLVRVAWT